MNIRCVLCYMNRENSHINDDLQKRQLFSNTLNVCKGLHKCNWDHEEECEEKEGNGNYKPLDCELYIRNCQVFPIYIAWLWGPLCQPCSWISALLGLCTNGSTPPSFEGDKCCRHDRVRIIYNPFSLCSYLETSDRKV